MQTVIRLSFVWFTIWVFVAFFLDRMTTDLPLPIIILLCFIYGAITMLVAFWAIGLNVYQLFRDIWRI